MSQEALSSPRGPRRRGQKTKPAELPQKEVRDRMAALATKKKKGKKRTSSLTAIPRAARCQPALTACEHPPKQPFRDGSARLLQAVWLFLRQPSDLFP